MTGNQRHIDEHASMISQLTPLSPQEARTAIALSNNGTLEEIKEITQRESSGGARNAKNATRKKLLQSNILSQYKLSEIADHIRTTIPPVPSYGLHGIEVYIGKIAAGKSVLAKTHAHSLLNTTNQLSIIALDNGANGWENLLRHHNGEGKVIGTDPITLPDLGNLHVWDLPSSVQDFADEWFNTLLTELQGATHNIIVFIDSSYHFLNDNTDTITTSITQLPAYISIRGIGTDTQRGLNNLLRCPCHQRIHTFNTRNMTRDDSERTQNSNPKHTGSDKTNLRLSDMEWQWTQNAALGNEKEGVAEVVVKEYEVESVADSDENTVTDVSKPMYVRSAFSNEHLSKLESERMIVPATGEIDWGVIRSDLIHAIERMSVDEYYPFHLRYRHYASEYKTHASRDEWESLCEEASEYGYDLNEIAASDGYSPVSVLTAHANRGNHTETNQN